MGSPPHRSRAWLTTCWTPPLVIQVRAAPCSVPTRQGLGSWNGVSQGTPFCFLGLEPERAFPAGGPDLLGNLRHVAGERTESAISHHHRGDRRRGNHRSVALAVADQRHLSEEVAGSQVREVLSTADDFGAAVLQHEELVAESALGDDAAAGLDVDLVRLPCDLLALIARELREQLDVLQVLGIHPGLLVL